MFAKIRRWIIPTLIILFAVSYIFFLLKLVITHNVNENRRKSSIKTSVLSYVELRYDSTQPEKDRFVLSTRAVVLKGDSAQIQAYADSVIESLKPIVMLSRKTNVTWKADPNWMRLQSAKVLDLTQRK